MPDLRIGLLGCGRHGERYLRHLARGDVDGMRPVALWRRDAKTGMVLAEQYGVEFVDSPDGLLDRGLFSVTTCPFALQKTLPEGGKQSGAVNVIV